ncbi:hypothetical protein SAMN02787081_02121 [Lysinibacillus fusiformis]|uniref:Lipoprotein n=1 Tax=Lysinibacillus fusiformis TaxID=28031 RepID=A0A1H9HSF1_9BACI|nr:hypothetical protein SAMN02787081_02121 [Lysinibacillus fusiformis]SEN47669.1 hypothetical protein SAMN02787103_01900 [Lysinibacillus fusiformis]SEQ65178.1 hypothetical protein SAMN02787113_02134 [Lysinibacillus fusiformis]
MKKLMYVMVFASLLLTACGKSDDPKEVAVDQNTSVEDIVGAIVKNEFTVEESKGVVTISIQDTDVTEGSKSQMLKDSTKIFADLSKLKDVKTPAVTWYAPLTEPNGDKTMTEVLNIYFSKEDYHKVDWANYLQVDIESTATNYHESEALED